MVAQGDAMTIRKAGRSVFSRIRDRKADRTDRPHPALTPADIEIAQIEAAKQDPQAFAPLYETYADLVWRFALSRLGDRERAADATSQTFSRALAALPRYQPRRQGDGTTFRSWLMTIARNVVIDETRKERPTTPIDAPSVQHRLVDRGRSPEEHAVIADERRRIEAALAQLPATQRKIVELRAIGTKSTEIAEVLQMSHAAVRTANHRAYVRLRDLLGPPDSDEGTSR